RDFGARIMSRSPSLVVDDPEPEFTTQFGHVDPIDPPADVNFHVADLDSQWRNQIARRRRLDRPAAGRQSKIRLEQPRYQHRPFFAPRLQEFIPMAAVLDGGSPEPKAFEFPKFFPYRARGTFGVLVHRLVEPRQEFLVDAIGQSRSHQFGIEMPV